MSVPEIDLPLKDRRASARETDPASASLTARSKILLENHPWTVVVGLACASLLALGLVDNARGPLLSSIMDAYALNHTQASWFFFLASGAGLAHNAIFLGYLSRAQPLRLLRIYMAVMALGVLILGITPLISSSYAVFLLGAITLGIGFGGLGVAQNLCVQEAPDEYRAQSTALLHAMYGLASLSSPFLIVQLKTWGLSGTADNWSLSFVICALPALAMLPLISRVLRAPSSPQGSAKMHVGVGQGLSASVPEPLQVQVSQRGEDTSGRKLSEPRPSSAWLAAVLLGFMVVAEISISSRLVIFAEESGWPAATAGLWLTGFFVALTLARLSLAIGLFDRFEQLALGLWMVLRGIPRDSERARTPDPSLRLRLVLWVSAPLLLLGLVDWGFPTQIRMMALVIFGFPIAMAYPLAMTWYAKAFGSQKQRVLSLAVTLQSAAAMCMHLLLGWGADRWGLRSALLAMSFGGLILALLLLGPLRRQLVRASASKAD